MSTRRIFSALARLNLHLAVQAMAEQGVYVLVVDGRTGPSVQDLADEMRALEVNKLPPQPSKSAKFSHDSNRQQHRVQQHRVQQRRHQQLARQKSRYRSR